MAEQARLMVFHKEFREDLRFWVQTDRKVALKALELVEAIVSDPFRESASLSH